MKRLFFPALASGLVMAPLLHAEALWEQSKRLQQQYNVVQREREYTQRVIDNSYRQAQADRAYNNRSSKVGSYFQSARDQEQENWDYEMESRPLSAEQQAKIEAGEKMRMAIMAQVDAERARQERDRQEMLAIVAGIKQRAANEEARRAALDERAKAGDLAAATEVAALHIEYSTFTPLELDRIRRAAELGDRASLAKMLTLKREIPADEYDKWETAALVWGEPKYSVKKAAEIAKTGDLNGAEALLVKALAKTPDARTATALASVWRDQGRIDEALTQYQRALALCKGQEVKIGYFAAETIFPELRKVPVTRETAPQILSLFEQLGGLGKYGGAWVHVYLGDIYSGQVEAWRGTVELRSDFRKHYDRAVDIYPDLHGEVAYRLADYGDFDGAEKMFERGVAKKNYRTVHAAGRFWADRTDGKADGRKAVALIGRVAPGGDLQRLSGTAAECGDILRQGKGTPVDIDGAIEWYNRGYMKQEIESTRRLAAMIYLGDGMPADEAKALRILDGVKNNNTTDLLGINQATFDAAMFRFTKAMRATQGRPDAVASVFEEYRMIFSSMTDGRHPDPRALEFYGRALLDGDINRGFPDSEREGWALMEKAAELGNAQAKAALAFRSLNQQASLTSAQRGQVFKDFLSLAEAGEPRGTLGLGICYRLGVGTPVDADKAVYWLQWAMDHGIGEARNVLLAQLKEGSEEQRDEALRMVRDDADKGSLEAQTEMGLHYLARRDGVMAMSWFRKAEAKRHWPAVYQALKLRYTGAPGVAAKGEQALTEAEEACWKAGDAMGIYRLAQIYAKDPEAESFLPKPDYDRAIELMSKAYNENVSGADDKRREYQEKRRDA